jgi:GntR family transcriptional repressor for pyruvate dehydrogenase complex
MAIRPLKSTSLVQEVLAQIRENILKGEWAQGEKIPSENELSRLLRVSRNTVRSAIHQLQAVGVLVSKQGQGTFVRTSFESTYMGSVLPFISLSKEEILDLLEFRKIIEAGSVALASVRAETDDIVKIGDALERMLAHLEDYEAYSKADFDFHLAIARASRNKLIYEVLNRLSVSLYSHIAEMNKAFGAKVSSENHRKIFQSIREKDVERAKKLMQENIQESIDMVRKAELIAVPQRAPSKRHVKGRLDESAAARKF